MLGGPYLSVSVGFVLYYVGVTPSRPALKAAGLLTTPGLCPVCAATLAEKREKASLA